MTQNDAEKSYFDFNRREFIKGASLSSLMLAMGSVPLLADDKTNATPEETHYSTVGPPVACGVIGCGLWGREVIQTLALLPNAPVPAICDNAKAALNRAKEFAPKAEVFEDYHKLLEQKDVEGVIIATPTHLHREIVEAALKAGKHVYCEAPLAHTIEDARAIAQAAKAASKVNFQSGLQRRSDPAMNGVLKFIRNGAAGKAIMARSQWHKKDAWRRPATPERDKIVNWRLDKTNSLGLIGEIGIHQLDLVNWFLNEHPVAATGFGGILNWDDGRDVADTIQSVLQYPSKANYFYDCTRCNSFDGEYDMIYGVFAAVMVRGSKAWLFKEADAPQIGIEVYASKEQFYKESGISLAADATVSVKNGKPVEESPFARSALHYALRSFVENSHIVAKGVSDFVSSYGADAEGLGEYIAGLAKSRLPAAGYQEGFEATVTAIKANEAVVQGQKIALGKELFEI